MVPRTVAELYLPFVRNVPLPLPHSAPRTDFLPRFFFLAAAAEAPLIGAHSERGGSPVSARSVMSTFGCAGFVLGVDCLTAKMPS